MLRLGRAQKWILPASSPSNTYFDYVKSAGCFAKSVMGKGCCYRGRHRGSVVILWRSMTSSKKTDISCCIPLWQRLPGQNHTPHHYNSRHATWKVKGGSGGGTIWPTRPNSKERWQSVLPCYCFFAVGLFSCCQRETYNPLICVGLQELVQLREGSLLPDHVKIVVAEDMTRGKSSSELNEKNSSQCTLCVSIMIFGIWKQVFIMLLT